MADRYPRPSDELAAENEALRAEVASLLSSVGSLQAAVVARDAEIAGLRRPKPRPRALDPAATDAFRRPAYGSRRV